MMCHFTTQLETDVVGKNAVYAVLLIGGFCAIYFYAWPKYREATGANIQPVTAPAAAPGAGASPRTVDGY
jgi:hypothetical protein